MANCMNHTSTFIKSTAKIYHIHDISIQRVVAPFPSFKIQYKNTSHVRTKILKKKKIKLKLDRFASTN